MKINVSVSSANKVFYEGLADVVVMKTINGQIGIMANHIPLMTVLKNGWVKIKNDEEEFSLDIENAVAKVVDNQLDILSFS